MMKWPQMWPELMLVLVWIGVMLWIASRPETFFFAPDTKVIYGVPRRFIQYPYHVSASFMLTILFVRCFVAFGGMGRRQALPLAFLAAATVSICCETIQLYVPTRGASLKDLKLDLIGAALGIVVTTRIYMFRVKSR